MAAVISVIPPFPVFADVDGDPLESGYIYIGVAGTNPLVGANQIATFSDDALTIPIAQPIRTIGGYPVLSGSPTRIYTGASDYSVAIQNKNGTLVFSSLRNKTKIGLIDLSTDVTGLLDSSSIRYIRTPQEIAAGVVPINYAYPELWLPRYGAVDGGDPTVNHTAIENAVLVAIQHGGGDIIVPSGDFDYDDQFELYDGVRFVGIGGGGPGISKSALRYVGNVFQDAIINHAGQATGMGLLNLVLYGGPFQQGKARYVVNMSAWNRNCVIRDCEIRDGVGLIKIASGYYGEVSHSLIHRPTPSQVAAGVSDAEWLQVYGASVAPVMFTDMNGSDCSHLKFDTIVSQNNTGVVPTYAIIVSGQDVDCRSWTLETIGRNYTAGAAYTPRVGSIINNQGYVTFDDLYVEAVDATNFLIFASGEAVTRCRGFSIYDSVGATAFQNQAMGDMQLDKGVAYRVDYNRPWFASSTTIGAGGDVITGSDIRWMAGNRLTDAGVNADTGNVYDTFGTTHPYGAAEGSDLRFHNARINAPRTVTGLAVTKSSDANGPYIQVTAGVFLSERGVYRNCKMRTDSSTSGNMAVQRLRPNVISKFYRVFVGRFGQLYLVENAVAFTDPTGDWLADFPTDGVGAIGAVTANPRLSIRGNYIVGTTQFIAQGTAAPVANTWNQGDQVMNSTPAAAGPPGWVCTVAGTPGTWKARANVAA